MKIVSLVSSVRCFAMLVAITSLVILGATSVAMAGTLYTWNPTTLTATNWKLDNVTGWNSAGGYPGSAGDLTLGADRERHPPI